MNAGSIDVRRDFGGIRIAAFELWVESFHQEEVDQLLVGCTPEDAQHALETVVKGVPERTISRGYYLWALYLMWLKQICELPGARLELLADEAEGMLALAHAERRFRKEYPACFRCGAANHEFAGACRKCNTDLK